MSASLKFVPSSQQFQHRRRSLASNEVIPPRPSLFEQLQQINVTMAVVVNDAEAENGPWDVDDDNE